MPPGKWGDKGAWQGCLSPQEGTFFLFRLLSSDTWVLTHPAGTPQGLCICYVLCPGHPGPLQRHVPERSRSGGRPLRPPGPQGPYEAVCVQDLALSPAAGAFPAWVSGLTLPYFCGGSLNAGWERISRQRTFQKGVSLLRTKSRDNVAPASKQADLLSHQGKLTVFVD